jgi:hypothetical protein
VSSDLRSGYCLKGAATILSIRNARKTRPGISE